MKEIILSLLMLPLLASAQARPKAVVFDELSTLRLQQLTKNHWLHINYPNFDSLFNMDIRKRPGVQSTCLKIGLIRDLNDDMWATKHLGKLEKLSQLADLLLVMTNVDRGYHLGQNNHTFSPKVVGEVTSKSLIYRLNTRSAYLEFISIQATEKDKTIKQVLQDLFGVMEANNVTLEMVRGCTIRE